MIRVYIYTKYVHVNLTTEQLESWSHSQPPPTNGRIHASGLPSSSLKTTEVLRSWLITLFSRQLYTLARMANQQDSCPQDERMKAWKTWLLHQCFGIYHSSIFQEQHGNSTPSHDQTVLQTWASAWFGIAIPFYLAINQLKSKRLAPAFYRARHWWTASPSSTWPPFRKRAQEHQICPWVEAQTRCALSNLQRAIHRTSGCYLGIFTQFWWPIASGEQFGISSFTFQTYTYLQFNENHTGLLKEFP